MFILAPSVGWLFVGRVLSGLSAGLVTGTATAALAETVGGSSSRRATRVATAANMGGLGLGPLVAGLFAQFGPNPTVLVFEVYLALLAVAALGLVVLPESLAVRQRLTLRFTGLGIPTVGRGEFISAGLAVFAAFALLGLFSSLVPSFLSDVLHEQSHAVSGAVVFAMFASAAVVAVLLSRFATRPVVLSGLGILLPALALIVAGLSQASMALFLIGTIVGGVAVGAIFIGSLSTANRLAPAENRGRVVSTYFVFAYVGLTIPVIAVGIAAQNVGDFRAVLACAIALAVLSAWSFVGIKRGRIEIDVDVGVSTRRLSYRHRRVVLVGWFLVTLGIVSLAVIGRGSTVDDFTIPGTQSSRPSPSYSGRCRRSSLPPPRWSSLALARPRSPTRLSATPSSLRSRGCDRARKSPP